jgi:hypothetical protein
MALETSASESPALVLRVPNDIQRLWFTLAQRPWHSLVLLPADFRTSVGALGEALAQAGVRAGAGPVRCVDAQSLELIHVARVIEELAQSAQDRRMTLVATSSPLVSPAAIPLALAADATVLCVELGTSDRSAAQQTLELVGRSRFLGAVAVSPHALR